VGKRKHEEGGQFGMAEIELKPLQLEMVNSLREAMKRSKKVILQASTGVGKTVLAASITKSALSKGKTVLFIVHRIILADQTSEMFSYYDIPHGVIRAKDERFDIHQPCQVASIQTLKRRGCNPADLIIIDEAHLLFSAHKEIIKNNPNSYIVGLTASPYAKELGKYFDFHIRPVSPRKLVEEKYLVSYDVYGPTIADLKKLKVVAGEFSEESQSEVFDKVDIIGDVVKMWKKITLGRKTIIFGVNVAHIKNLVDQFRAAGISATQINAYQQDWERKEALDGYLNGTTTVLCSVEAAVAGFDAPDTEVCGLAMSTRSIIKLTQTVGRALRIFPGKEKAFVLDFGGNFERLGFPDDYDFFALDDGKKKKAAERIKKERLPKVCPSCDFVKPIGVRECPACGFVPDFKQDVEVAEGDLKKLQRKVVKQYTVEQKQSFLAQLNTYAEAHGMKQGKGGCFGWSLYKYAEKFGVQPSGKINWGAREPVGDEVSRYITYCNIKYAKRKLI
jgi:DNA repair protein RadD